MLEREFMLFKAGCGQVAAAVAGDLPSAITRMDKMISSLEAYVALAAPTSGAPPVIGTPSDAPTEITSDHGAASSNVDAQASSHPTSTTHQEPQP